jgi:hypothetical protein
MILIIGICMQPNKCRNRIKYIFSHGRKGQIIGRLCFNKDKHIKKARPGVQKTRSARKQRELSEVRVTFEQQTRAESHPNGVQMEYSKWRGVCRRRRVNMCDN